MKNMKKNIGIIVKIFVGVSAAAFVFVNAAGASDSVIDLMAGGTGAAAMGMGGAAVATMQGVFAPAWNPAGLAALPAPAIGSQYASMFGDVNRYGLNFAMPLMGGAIGLGYLNESVTGIPLTHNDENGRPVYEGAFSDVKEAMALSYAHQFLAEGLFLGANAKFAKNTLYNQSVSGIGLDAGLIFRPAPQGFSLGLMARNILAPKFSWASGYQDTMARKLAAGAAWQGPVLGNDALISAEAEMMKGEPVAMRLGAQYTLWQQLPIRLGLNQGVFTAGLGLKFGQIVMDYAYTAHNDLGPSHQASLTVIF